MGTAVGLGSYDVAIVLSLITLLTLWVLSPLKTELGVADNANRSPPDGGEEGGG
jgi:putative Mg2+ transporter-C (MgtC) family protein